MQGNHTTCFDNLLAYWLSIFGESMAEDFNKLKMINKRLVQMDFQKEWLFKLEIEDAPEELDFYVKDLSLTPMEISTDEDNIGGTTMVWPTGRSAAKLMAIMRDNEKGEISAFISQWEGKAVHRDGTVGLPYGDDGYLKPVTFYWLKDDAAEKIFGQWEMYPINSGEISMSRENSGHLEFQVSFVQFATSDNT